MCVEFGTVTSNQNRRYKASVCRIQCRDVQSKTSLQCECVYNDVHSSHSFTISDSNTFFFYFMYICFSIIILLRSLIFILIHISSSNLCVSCVLRGRTHPSLLSLINVVPYITYLKRTCTCIYIQLS